MTKDYHVQYSAWHIVGALVNASLSSIPFSKVRGIPALESNQHKVQLLALPPACCDFGQLVQSPWALILSSIKWRC